MTTASTARSGPWPERAVLCPPGPVAGRRSLRNPDPTGGSEPERWSRPPEASSPAGPVLGHPDPAGRGARAATSGAGGLELVECRQPGPPARQMTARRAGGHGPTARPPAPPHLPTPHGPPGPPGPWADGPPALRADRAVPIVPGRDNSRPRAAVVVEADRCGGPGRGGVRLRPVSAPGSRTQAPRRCGVCRQAAPSGAWRPVHGG